MLNSTKEGGTKPKKGVNRMTQMRGFEEGEKSNKRAKRTLATKKGGWPKYVWGGTQAFSGGGPQRNPVSKEENRYNRASDTKQKEKNVRMPGPWGRPSRGG